MRPLSIKLGSAAEAILNRIRPGFAYICKRRMEIERNDSSSPLVKFDWLRECDDIEPESLLIMSNPALLKFASSEIVEVDIQDIELEERDKYGRFVVMPKSDIVVRYGDKGIATSKNIIPSDLLKYEIIIPARNNGILSIQKHVPFKLSSENLSSTVFSGCKLKQVLSHEENIRRYWINTLITMDLKDLTSISKSAEKTILESGGVEIFFEEVTAPIAKPKEHVFSGSVTGMIFKGETTDDRKTSPMHYHPGWRVLFIYTTDIPSGVLLNFCGVEEDPSKRLDTSVRIDFKPNSWSSLEFPPYTHHKFFGKFVCTSQHPKEGTIFLENYFKKKLDPKVGFLEANTIFSKVSNPEIISEQTNWRLSAPQPSSEPEKSNSR